MRAEQMRKWATGEFAPATARGDLLIISASASKTSRSELLGGYLTGLLTGDYRSIDHLRVRELPPAGLACADVNDPAIAAAILKLSHASAVVFITPTYKGSYSGLLKMFIDLLPQYALRGKLVLPLATGGTVAHVQMMDYALRPVLQTMWPKHIAQSCFILDQSIVTEEDGAMSLAGSSGTLLGEIVAAFEHMVALSSLNDSQPLPIQN